MEEIQQSKKKLNGSRSKKRVERGLHIGITIGLREAGESMWINGIKQNAIYLAKMFAHSPRAHRVTLVNTTDVSLDGALPWDRATFPTESFETVKDSLDVLIELGGQISGDQTDYLKRRGARLVSYCCGPEYVQNMESMLFSRGDVGPLFINPRYDEVWVIPQIVESSWHFFGALRRRPMRAVPFVWDPMCLEARSAHLPHAGEYRPRHQPKRLAVMEPNMDVFKFCMYPMLIADSAYRKVGDAIDRLYVTNSDHLATRSPMFISLAQTLDLVRDSRAAFAGRFDTPAFLSEHADIVISHQWGLALNYFYFDVCWQGFALVHNAHLCRDLGYFYPENDVEAGATQLVRAVEQCDVEWEAYRRLQRENIDRFLSTNTKLIASYDELLDQLMATPAAA